MNLFLIDRIGQSHKVQRLHKAARTTISFLVSRYQRLQLSPELKRRSEVHIHFGCGDIDDGRFINVDARALPHVHIVSKSPFLRPFPDGSADSIYCCHAFEHLSYRIQRTVLTRWRQVLKPGGILMLSVPDFDKLVHKYLASGRDPLSIQGQLMGGQEYVGNFHCAIFTRTQLIDLLYECGFVQVAEWHPRDRKSWPRDYSWVDCVSLNIMGAKPEHQESRLDPTRP